MEKSPVGRERTAEQYLSRPFQEAMGSKKLRVSIPSLIQSEEHVTYRTSPRRNVDIQYEQQ